METKCGSYDKCEDKPSMDGRHSPSESSFLVQIRNKTSIYPCDIFPGALLHARTHAHAASGKDFNSYDGKIVAGRKRRKIEPDSDAARNLQAGRT